MAKFYVGEIGEWGDQLSVYAGHALCAFDNGLVVDRPTWSGTYDDAFDFGTLEDAQRFADDMSDYYASKGYGCRCAVFATDA